MVFEHDGEKPYEFIWFWRSQHFFFLRYVPVASPSGSAPIPSSRGAGALGDMVAAEPEPGLEPVLPGKIRLEAGQ